MPHRRSKLKLLRSEARKFIFRVSFRDPELAETVCRCDLKQVQAHVKTVYPEDATPMQSDLPEVTKGLVLVDSKGNGAYQ